MAIKITDFQLPEEVLEEVYSVASVVPWNKNGQAGWTYDCILPKMRYEKIQIKVVSEHPVITPEQLGAAGLVNISFDNLKLSPYAMANNGFVNVGITASADKARLIK